VSDPPSHDLCLLVSEHDIAAVFFCQAAIRSPISLFSARPVHNRLASVNFFFEADDGGRTAMPGLS